MASYMPQITPEKLSDAEYACHASPNQRLSIEGAVSIDA